LTSDWRRISGTGVFSSRSGQFCVSYIGQFTGHGNKAGDRNGLGAPRAFDTSVLRRIGFPNVSYGEDYAVALRISRDYEIGRIYESVYLCRRWEGNSDSALPLEVANRYDLYKDRLRTIEIQARMRG